jgi:acyl dehydratase
MKIAEGDMYEYEFSFTQEEVVQFAKLSGDMNPIHLDAEYAAQTPFKKPIIHGIFSASVFSKVLGTEFPGHGSIYLKQQLEFLRPMYVGTAYKASFTVLEINAAKHTATIETVITDVQTKKKTVIGQAVLMHPEKF